MATQVTTGNAATSTLPIEDQKFANLSPASQVVMVGRTVARFPFMALLTNEIGLTKETVTDVEYKTLSEHPMATDLLIQGDNGAGAAAALTTSTTTISLTDISTDISNANRLIRAGDLIHLAAKQDNQTTADGTVATSGEVIRVVSINAAGDIVTVARNHGATAAVTNNVAAGSGNTLHGTIVGASIGETDTSRDGISHAMLTQTNYLQEFEEPFVVSDDAQAITLVGGNPLAREMEQKRIKFLEDIERAMLFGKGATSFTNSVATHTTRGLTSYIAGDSLTAYGTYTAANDLVTGNGTERVWVVGGAGELSQSNLITLMERVYTEGSDNKVLFGGPGFVNAFLQSLQGFLSLDFVRDTGANLGFGFQSITTPFSPIPLRLMMHPMMKGSHSNSAIIADLDYVRMAVLPGRDIQMWKGKGGFGLQANDARVTKWAWTAKVGLDVTYQLAHAHVIGLEDTAGNLTGQQRTVGTNDPSNT
jgi:hypothetical protein